MRVDPILIVGVPSEWARNVISSLTPVSADQTYVQDFAAALSKARECQPRVVIICRTRVQELDQSGEELREAFPNSRIVILDDRF